MDISKPRILPEGKLKSELDISINKSIQIARVKGIRIDRFRSMIKQEIILGSRITVLSGRNGTMKTSLMGLIAHPFSSDSLDGLDRPLKTNLSEVFNLSKTYDLDTYNYSIISETTDKEFVQSPVEIYYTAGTTNRHRVVVSGSEKGDGNLSYNTSLLNLRRLYPIVDIAAQRKQIAVPELTDIEQKQLKRFYEKIFPSSNYGDFVGVHRPKIKSTWAPSGHGLGYDWQAMSSGEDNLGSIFNRLIGFQRDFKIGQKTGGGILCIDEFEASLHPVAQLRLFEYLLRWAGDYKTQVIITTHSLGLISDIYMKHSSLMQKDHIVINFVSKSTAKNSNYPILHNPPFELAYKELTFTSPLQVAQSHKLRIFCEDDIAIGFLKKIIKNKSIIDALEFYSSFDDESSKPGIPYTEIKPLQSACLRFPILFERSLVILDADVPDKFMTNLKIKDFCLRLPDLDHMALERRIVYYVVSLDNDHDFFRSSGQERDSFLSDFSTYDIPLTLIEISDEKELKIDCCKNWAKAHKADFNRCVAYYCKHELDKEQFIKTFLETINTLCTRIGMPPIWPQG